jgi:hypothetical protein
MQMQMLYVLGRITERSVPCSYFSFDGVVSSCFLRCEKKIKKIEAYISPNIFLAADRCGLCSQVSSLKLAPLTRFPQARYGYSFCCWLQVWGPSESIGHH